MERLQKIADESREVERHLEDLDRERRRCDEELASAEERLATVQLLARQAIDRAVAWEAVETARADMSRIQSMDRAVAEAEQRVRDLAALKEQAEQKVREAREAAASAGASLAAAEETAGALGSDMADTVARQEIELRKIAADQAVQTVRQRVEAVVRARGQVEAADRAEEEHRSQEAEAARVRETWAEATRAEKAANDALGRCALLERGVEARTLERQVADARNAVERESALQADLARVSGECSTLAERRAALVVPPAAILPALRKLETDSRAPGEPWTWGS